MGGDERYKRSINSPIRYIEDITAIKQDLEVLEIIRKKKVDVYYLSIALKFKLPIEEQLYYYNSIEHNNFKLTMEELLKLKQWLEENENG